MSTFQAIADAFRAISNAVLAAKLPAEIPVAYAPGSVAGSVPAGRHLLKLGEHGGASYEWRPDPVDFAPKNAIAPLQIGHGFNDSISMLEWLGDRAEDDASAADPELFLDVQPGQPGSMVGILDPARPELGSVCVSFRRHPFWVEWSAFANGMPRELPHEAFADLLLDNQRLLSEPALAILVARFKGAAKIEYQPTRDKAEYTGILVTWKGQATDAGGAPMELPRNFDVNLPPFIGAWLGGEEPALTASFSIRPIAPKEGGVVPTFRIRWDNAAEYEIQAQALLSAGVRAQIATTFGPDDQPPLYLGKAGVTHRLIPGPTDPIYYGPGTNAR